MSPASHHRTALERSRSRLVLGCFVALLAALFAFSVVGIAHTPVLSATEFDPETDHGELTDISSIHDADTASSPRAEIRDAFETAATDGRYEGSVQNASSTHSFLRNDRYDFVRFEGTFYEFEADIDGEWVVIEADERTPESIVDELAVDLEEVRDPVRETIETGEPVEASGGSLETPIVVDDGTYYVVTVGPPNHGSGTSLGLLLILIPAAAAVTGIAALAIGGVWLYRRWSGV